MKSQSDLSDVSVTVIITPRDRFSGALTNLEMLYQYTDESAFSLFILDLGYPKQILREIKQFLEGKPNAQIISLGDLIPLAAIREVRSQITTPYTMLLDNDSHVTENWLEPLLITAEAENAAIVSPVILEKSGVDEGEGIRNHVFTTKIHVVDVENTPYLVEYKDYRRAAPESLPKVATASESFELHGVLFNTKDLQAIELPHMTIREHLDIGMQLINLGRPILVEPKSIVMFDNLGTRAELADLKFFNRRWNPKVTLKSSQLFEKRWGYRFYSEPSIYNWAVRRRLFLIMRWMYLPIPIANKIDRLIGAVRRRLVPIWDPLPTAEEDSVSLYHSLGGKFPQQLSHAEQ